MTRVFLAVAAVLLIYLVMRGGLSPNTAPARPLHIYLSTTEHSKEGGSAVAAARLAFSQMRELSGARPVQLIVVENSDSNGNPSSSLELQNAQRAAQDEDAVAYVGPQNAELARISAPVLAAAGVAQVGYTDLSTVASVLRVVPSSDTTAAAAAAWLHSLGFASVYLVTDSTPGGQAFADSLRTDLQAIDMSVVGGEGATTASSIRDVASHIHAAAPSAVVYTGSSAADAAALLKRMRAGGTYAPFVISDGLMESAFITQAGKDAEGVYAVEGGAPARIVGTQAARDFNDAYARSTGAQPDQIAAFAYDAVGATIAAARSTDNPTRASVQAALASTKNFSGALGTWSFNSDGNTTATLVSGYSVQKGQWSFVNVLPVSQ